MEHHLTHAQSQALQRLLGGVIAIALGWYLVRLTAALALAALSRLRPSFRTLAVRCAPASARPLVRRALAGGLLTATLTAPAAIAAPDPCAAGTELPQLDRGCAAQPGAAGTPPPPAAPPHPKDAGPLVHRVAPGESLWRIADNLLRPGHADADVAAAWPELWRANRALIGENPDLIIPGTDLVIPQALSAGSAS